MKKHKILYFNFYLLGEVTLHTDFSHNNLKDTNTEIVTESPITALTGKKYC